MRILIVGATGVIGRAVLPLLQRAGHQVRALRRDGGSYPPPIETAPGELLDPASLMVAADGVDAVVNVASAIPTRADAGRADWVANDRLRDEGTRNLLGAIGRAGVSVHVHTSVALVYGLDRAGEVLDESADLRPPPIVETAVAGERHVAEAASAGLRTVILRPGWLYGPGSWHALDTLRRLRAGTAAVPTRPDTWISPVAAIDVAAAVRLLLEDDAAAGAFNVAGRPLPVATLWRGLAARLGWPAPRTSDGHGGVRSQRLSSQRLQSHGFIPRFPDARDGLADLATTVLEPT